MVDASAAARESPCTVLCLEQLAACPRVSSLELRGCDLGAWSGLHHLQRLCQLRLLDCTQTIPGDLMRELRPLTQLEVLQVQVGIPPEYAYMCSHRSFIEFGDAATTFSASAPHHCVVWEHSLAGATFVPVLQGLKESREDPFVGLGCLKRLTTLDLRYSSHLADALCAEIVKLRRSVGLPLPAAVPELLQCCALQILTQACLLTCHISMTHCITPKHVHWHGLSDAKTLPSSYPPSEIPVTDATSSSSDSSGVASALLPAGCGISTWRAAPRTA